jgi:hypothetical protein
MSRTTTKASQVPTIDSKYISTLDNKIHAIFAPIGWREFPSDEVKEKWLKTISPALQLATLFITTDSLLDWWARTMFGHEITDRATGTRFLHQRLAGEKWNKEVENTFQHLSQGRIAFVSSRWCENEASSNDFEAQGSAGGIIRQDSNGNPRRNRKTGELSRRYAITLNDEFYKCVAHEFDTWTLERKKIFLIHLACVLTHELAHVAYMATRADHTVIGSDGKWKKVLEPCHSGTEPKAELGLSWEASILGGTSPIRFSVSRKAFREGEIPLWRKVRDETQETLRAGWGYLNKKKYLSLLDKEKWEEIKMRGRDAFRLVGYSNEELIHRILKENAEKNGVWLASRGGVAG